jgi:hypothetical protein
MLKTEQKQQETIQKKKIEEIKSKKIEEPTFPFLKAEKEEIESYKKELENDKTLRESQLKPYQLQLTSEYVVAQLDNSLLINSYQPYSMNQGLFRQAPIGGMLKYAFTDLFEDHRVNIGFRIPVRPRGATFFFSMPM